jgi:hypothetical protein
VSAETVTEIGIDLIAPAVTIFTIGYFFMPWRQSRIGWALMSHAFGSMLLFDLAVLAEYGIIPEQYPGQDAVLILILVVWVFGWWALVTALPWGRLRDFLLRRHPPVRSD